MKIHTDNFGELMYIHAVAKEEAEKAIGQFRSNIVDDVINSLWIPVSRLLPNNECECLVTVQYDDILGYGNRTKVCRFHPSKGWCRNDATGNLEPAENKYEHVIAWMQFPKPYKKREI